MGTTESTTPLLDAQLCFALNDAARAIVGCYRPLLDAAGLTYTQYLVMLVLWEGPDPVPVGVLCERLHLDSGTLSPLLKRLEARGFVSRARSRADERSVEVSCTAAGQAVRGQVTIAQGDVVAATGLTRDEAMAMRADLVALTARLRAYEQAKAG